MPDQSTTFDKARKFLKYHQEAVLDQNPTYAKTIPSMYELIELYCNSKFRDGDGSDQGKKMAYFYNIVILPLFVAKKLIDLDTKDIRLIATGNQHYLPLYFMEKELDLWFKDNFFGRLLNKFAFQYPKYGRLRVKMVNDEIHLVKNKNWITDPCVEEYLNSDGLIHRHQFTASKLKRVGEKHGWDMKQIDSAIEQNLFNNITNGESFINVYEFYDFSKDKDNVHILTGLDTNFDKGKKDRLTTHELSTMTISHADMKNTYKESPQWEEVEGRSEGRGWVERLFENQIAKNDVSNKFHTALEHTSKQIYRSDDDEVADNLQRDVDDGDVIKTSDLEALPNNERNLHAYQYGDQKWDMNSDRNTFSQDSVRGEQAPSGTPLGSVLIQTQQATGFYDEKREDLGMFVKEIIEDWVVPSFKRNNSHKHTYNLMQNEEDFDRYLDLVVRDSANRFAFTQTMIRNGRVPTQNEIEAYKEIEKIRVRNSKRIPFEIPKGYYNDLKYKMDVVVTSENVDVQTELTTLQNLLTIRLSNPNAMRDPVVKRIINKMTNLVGGINSVDLEDNRMDVDMLGISQPQQGSSPVKLENPINSREQKIGQVAKQGSAQVL